MTATRVAFRALLIAGAFIVPFAQPTNAQDCWKCNSLNMCSNGWFCCALGCQAPGCTLIGAGQCTWGSERPKGLASVRLFRVERGVGEALFGTKSGGSLTITLHDGAGSKTIQDEVARLSGNSSLSLFLWLDALGAVLGRRFTSSEGDGLAFEAVPSAGCLQVRFRRLSRGDALGTDEVGCLAPGQVMLYWVTIGGEDYLVSLHGIALEKAAGKADKERVENTLAKILADTEAVLEQRQIKAIPIMSVEDRTEPDWSRLK